MKLTNFFLVCYFVFSGIAFATLPCPENSDCGSMASVNMGTYQYVYLLKSFLSAFSLGLLLLTVSLIYRFIRTLNGDRKVYLVKICLTVFLSIFVYGANYYAGSYFGSSCCSLAPNSYSVVISSSDTVQTKDEIKLLLESVGGVIKSNNFNSNNSYTIISSVQDSDSFRVKINSNLKKYHSRGLSDVPSAVISSAIITIVPLNLSERLFYYSPIPLNFLVYFIVLFFFIVFLRKEIHLIFFDIKFNVNDSSKERNNQNNITANVSLKESVSVVTKPQSKISFFFKIFTYLVLFLTVVGVILIIIDINSRGNWAGLFSFIIVCALGILYLLLGVMYLLKTLIEAVVEKNQTGASLFSILKVHKIAPVLLFFYVALITYFFMYIK